MKSVLSTLFAYPLSMERYVAFVGLLTLALVVATLSDRPVLLKQAAAATGVSEPVKAGPESFYVLRVQPIMDRYCTACHDASKSRGHLRVDDYLHTRYSGRSRTNVLPGEPERSGLLVRMKLPKSDLKAMPPLGLPAPTSDEMEVIRQWIERDASGSLGPSAFPNAPELVKPVRIPVLDKDAITAARAPLAGAVETLRHTHPQLVFYAARDTAELRVTNASIPGTFREEDLSALGPVAHEIVSLHLRRAAFSDDAIPVLVSMSKLRSAHLEGISLSETALRTLISELPALQRLSVDAELLSENIKQDASARGIEVYGVGDAPR